MVYISCSFIRKYHLYAHRAKNKQNPSEACVSHPHSWLYCVRINKRASKNQDSNTSSLNSVKLPKPSCFMAALRVFDASIKRTLHITLGLIPVDSLFLHLVCECDGEHTHRYTLAHAAVLYHSPPFIYACHSPKSQSIFYINTSY